MSLAMTIVICTRNRPTWVRNSAMDVLAQLGPQDRLVVVDQSTHDKVLDPKDRPESHAMTWLTAPPRGLPAARNLAMRGVKTPLVCYLDDDVMLRPGALNALRGAFASADVGGVSPRIEERRAKLNTLQTRCELGWDGRVRARLTGAQRVKLATLKGACMAYRTEALRAVGPCDEAFDGTSFLEDADWSARVLNSGWKLSYCPDAVIVHFSAPEEGCRAKSTLAFDRSRLRNTAYYLGKHRRFKAVLALPALILLAGRASLRDRNVSTFGLLMLIMLRRYIGRR